MYRAHHFYLVNVIHILCNTQTRTHAHTRAYTRTHARTRDENHSCLLAAQPQAITKHAVLQRSATLCNILRQTEIHIRKFAASLKSITKHAVLQHGATRCNTVQHGATRCNTPRFISGNLQRHLRR